jgi:hypothetical protein
MPLTPDYCDHPGAERLKAQIERYWRERDAMRAVVEAARKLRSGMNGHYANAEDLYCFDAAMDGYDATLALEDFHKNGGISLSTLQGET